MSKYSVSSLNAVSGASANEPAPIAATRATGRAETTLVASSASTPSATRGVLQPVGVRHAYRDGEQQTLCGLAVRYLFPVANTKWSPKTPLRCTACDAVAAGAQAA